MRIAFVIDSIVGGGAERATVNLANGLVKDVSKELFVFTIKQQADEYLLDEKVKRENFLTGNFFLDVKKIRKKLKEHHIDIAIGMSIYTNLCLSAANVFLNTRVVISERNAPKYDHISWKSRLLRWLLYRNADNYVFQTQEAKEFYSKSIQKRGVVIHNPVRTDIPYRTDVENKEIVAVGRLMPQKNYQLLLKAFAKVHEQHPEYKLRIFGQGREKEDLKTLASNLNIENAVVFEGFCLDVHDKIKNSSIFVMTSDFEGMPNSLMEAMAMGFPVVCTDCPAGGPRELIKSDKNGVLVPVGEVEKLSIAILTLIEDDHMRKEIANEARKIRDTHNIDVILNKWIEMIQTRL